MKEFLKKYMTKNNGIVLMVTAVFVILIMMMMIEWPKYKTFMECLSQGYIFKIEDENCRRYYSCEHTLFYFKYMVIIPVIMFLVGLYSALNGKR